MHMGIIRPSSSEDGWGKFCRLLYPVAVKDRFQKFNPIQRCEISFHRIQFLKIKTQRDLHGHSISGLSPLFRLVILFKTWKNIVQNWRNIDQILKEILFKIWQTQYFQMIKRPCMWFCYDELHHFVQKFGQMEIVFAILGKNLVKWK